MICTWTEPNRVWTTEPAYVPTALAEAPVVPVALDEPLEPDVPLEPDEPVEPDVPLDPVDPVLPVVPAAELAAVLPVSAT
ncbi:hypothetical protein NicSoilB8_42630 [Arthrobacter sp. NicSoilB8]|nr:hypothetical protein NicSoilB8_42630 [Arthrobacter sp. NicSoilB8]